ncbi:uncharacterized protein si:dkey-192g7.3 [Rhinichthys klamathensis goyatoka]|uniref:uncharacterized protein si:dkey-192g7.3 n=1 Tax=Rhinichthys klamathensis goyatoka TaxID=3034132 RepID=UPI0024B4930C|nr:uncharacterized protein si:dkey-192g7.3 [Rhinichthys klamathensis goyatoka]
MRACLLQRKYRLTQRTTMMILALLTLLLITNGSAVETSATGIVGQTVILPCGCTNVSKLVWQKGETVVNGYPQERKSIDQAHIDRTELFLEKEKTNCSLMILNITSADAGVYTCHALFSVSDRIWSRKELEVNLTVSEKEDGGQLTFSGDKTDNTVSISVPIVVVLIFAVAVLLTLLIKRRHRTNTDTDLPAQQPMIKSV